MNVVERTNPSGRMGKLEETEAGEEVKGGKERRRTTRGVGKEGALTSKLGDGGRGSRIVWAVWAVRLNTTQTQATTRGKRGLLHYPRNSTTVLSTTASNCPVRFIILTPSHLALRHSVSYHDCCFTVSPPSKTPRVSLSLPLPPAHLLSSNSVQASTPSVSLGMGLAASSTLEIAHRGASK
jgi:hypothetical protein